MYEIPQLSAYACVSNIKGNPLSRQQHKVCLCYHNIAKIFSILKVARGKEREKAQKVRRGNLLSAVMEVVNGK
jgi:hypothetical protein